MKWTRASVEEDAQKKGLESIQIDGVPEGFAWKEPDIEIDGVMHTGQYVLYGPLGLDVVRMQEIEGMARVYESFKEVKYGKANHERARSETEDKEGN